MPDSARSSQGRAGRPLAQRFWPRLSSRLVGVVMLAIDRGIRIQAALLPRLALIHHPITRA